MYPGTIIEYVDQSFIEPITIETVANRPLLFALFTSDKGPESFQKVYGKDFFNLYGNNISFEKHGQPLLQAAMSINSGAELFCKRVVASDSKLAYNGIIAKIDSSGSIPTISHFSYTNEYYSPADAEALCTSMKDFCDSLFLRKAVSTPVYAAVYSVSEGAKIQLYTSITYETPVSVAVPDICDASGKLLKTENLLFSETPQTSQDPNLGWYFTENSVTYYVKKYDDNGSIQLTDISDEHWYPLIAITDNGRGTSTKSYSVIENSKLSKNLSFAVYDIDVHEGIDVIESIHCSIDPNAISGATSMSLNEQTRSAIQIDAYQDSEQYDELVQLIMSKTGKSRDEIISEDFIFGRTRSGQTPLGWLVYKDGSTGNVEILFNAAQSTDPLYQACININDYTDLALSYGSNGSFGNRPINAANYGSTMNQVFAKHAEGTKQVENYPEIYNLDEYKIIAVIDANYPSDVKDSMAEYVSVREDCVFLRDMGTSGLDTSTAIKTAVNAITNKSKFTSLYCQYYDIKDPYSYKQITVSIGYSLARLLINQFNNGISLPLAGQKYGVTIPEAIYGTLNFSPLNLPSGNQKEEFDDLRVNYASYFDDLLVIESEYTTYEKFSQFSYLNNILAIQEAIRAVRTRCPIIRYSFITGGDFDAYQADVNSVLSNYSNNFVSLELEYLGDDTYVANKIFYAAIKVRFRDFVQTEWFKVIALGNNSSV